MVYRFSHGMYYANSPTLAEELSALARVPALRWLCIDCAAVDDVDFTAAEVLIGRQRALVAGGVRLVLAAVAPAVRTQLERSGLTTILGADSFFGTLDDVVEGYASTVGR